MQASLLLIDRFTKSSIVKAAPHPLTFFNELNRCYFLSEGSLCRFCLKKASSAKSSNKQP